MDQIKGAVMRCKLFACLFGVFVLANPVFAQSDMQDKIRKLEQQIEELRALKTQQNVVQQKADQCVRAVGKDKFCSCIAEKLPASVSFEQYIHTLVTSKEQLGYAALAAEQKKLIDDTLAVRDKCVEKGFLW